jgi:Ca2+-binding RTX toxin-like protein
MKKRSVMRCVLPLLFGVACATDEYLPEDVDLGDIEGIEEIEEGLTDLTSRCTFTAATGVLVLALQSGDIAMIGKATDGRVVINGFGCSTATSTSTKRIDVTGAGGAETVILDYLGGTFSLGLSTGAGITVDLGAGTDALKIRGSKLADTYTFGSTGIAINADNNVDVTHTAVETFVVTLTDGNDVFSGAGNTATGGAEFASVVTVYGGAGNDTIRGGSGNDIYHGGDGDDTFQGGTVDDGSDTMNGGNNTDTADYSARTAALTVTIDGTGNDGESGEADDVEADVEAVKGGSANDSITGSATANTLSGGGGNDTLTGGLGDDILNGEAGDDSFAEGAATSGADTMNGGAGTDTANYGSRTNAVGVNLNATADDGESGELDKVMIDVENVTGGAGADTLTGSTSNNVLDGGGAIDTISGGDGDDTLRGAAGNDILTGGNGNDTFDEGAAASGADTMAGGAGVDKVNYGARTMAVTIVMDGTTQGGESGENDLVDDDIEDLQGGTAADTITGNALDNTLSGGAAVDTINGGAGDDAIDGEAGADVIDCGAGDGDVLLDSTAASPVNCEL